MAVVTERVFCNTCRQWSRMPYRRGRCARCTGVQVGSVHVCCGDCDQYPCACAYATDNDQWIPALADHDDPALFRPQPEIEEAA
ncbi:hypothetical protein ACQI4L_09185 [Mycolicibacterium litorale]|uniref:hypothetical protein n=1 Tax=Mycolicibacterium litorale TaxID=758802 RepID=UPI003CEA135F